MTSKNDIVHHGTFDEKELDAAISNRWQLEVAGVIRRS